MTATRPASRFDWERVIRRANLPTTTKLVALLMATYADEDGTSIHPGEELLSRVVGINTRNTRTHVTKLRKVHLLMLVSRADRFRGRADEYRLVVPTSEEGLAALDLLDPSERHRSPATSDPVDNSEVTGRVRPVTGGDTPGETPRSPVAGDAITGRTQTGLPVAHDLPPTHSPTTDQPTDLSSPSDVQSAVDGNATTKTGSRGGRRAAPAPEECAGGHGGAPGRLPNGDPMCAQCRRGRLQIIEGGRTA